MRLLVLALLILTGCSNDKIETITEAEQIQALVNKLAPNNAPVGSFEHIANIVNLVHTRTPLQQTSPRFKTASKYENVLWALTDPTYGHICGGKAITVKDILDSYGYEAHIVQGFAATPDGHVMVQVNGYIVDPTFNIYYVNKHGQPIGAAELSQRFHTAQPIEPRYLAPSVYPLENYYMPVQEVFYIVRVLPPYVRSTSSLSVVYPGEQVFQ